MPDMQRSLRGMKIEGNNFESTKQGEARKYREKQMSCGISAMQTETIFARSRRRKQETEHREENRKRYADRAFARDKRRNIK